ncbi:hypothetical protein GCM10007092_14650 [Thermus composti]|nr:hypothetical protein GCM10007092_14650 [Thermus composti]
MGEIGALHVLNLSEGLPKVHDRGHGGQTVDPQGPFPPFRARGLAQVPTRTIPNKLNHRFMATTAKTKIKKSC